MKLLKYVKFWYGAYFVHKHVNINWILADLWNSGNKLENSIRVSDEEIVYIRFENKTKVFIFIFSKSKMNGKRP